MVPLTVGWLGGLSDDGDAEGSTLLPALAYTAGLASALSALGVSAALLGQLFGSAPGPAASALPLLVSLVAMYMGFSLLECLPFNLPPIDLSSQGPGAGSLPAGGRAFAAGASAALTSTPCASPVLASILAYAGSTGKPLIGGVFLLLYTLGFTSPVLAAGVATGTAKRRLAELGEGGANDWIPPISGAALLAVGTYSAVTAVFGPA